MASIHTDVPEDLGLAALIFDDSDSGTDSIEHAKQSEVAILVKANQEILDEIRMIQMSVMKIKDVFHAGLRTILHCANSINQLEEESLLEDTKAELMTNHIDGAALRMNQAKVAMSHIEKMCFDIEVMINRCLQRLFGNVGEYGNIKDEAQNAAKEREH